MCVATARSCCFKFQFLLDNFIPNVNSWKTRRGAYQNVSVPITSRYGPRIEMCSVFSSPRENQQGMFFWSILAIFSRSAIKSQVFRERVGFVVLCIIGAYCSMRRGTSKDLTSDQTLSICQSIKCPQIQWVQYQPFS